MNISDITAEYLDISIEYLDIDPEYPFFSVYVHPEKSIFDLNKISLNQANLCIVIRSKKSFFDLEKFLDCFYSLN